MNRKKKREIVVYDNNFIEAFYQSDLLAKKIMIATSLTCQDEAWAENEDLNIIISSNELRRLSGLKRDSLKHLEDTLTKLHETVIKTRRIDDKEYIHTVNYLSEGTYENGELTLRINKSMRPYVIGLKKNFTQYHIENIKPLKSNYSIRIFELLKMHSFRGKYRVEIEEFKKMLGLENKYENFNDLKKRVLKAAGIELREHCEVYFEYEEIKKGNKVTEIEFTILRQTKEFSAKELPAPPVEYIDIKDVPEEEVPYQGDLFDMSFQPQYSELGQKLIKMGFMGDPEKFIQNEGKELVEITLKAVEATSGVNNPIGLLRERVKTIKIQTVLLMQEQEAKRKKEEADLKFAIEKELVAEAKIKESEKRDLEKDAKYSGYLADFYEYCQENPSNDFLKADFINDFKQNFALKEITRFSEIGGIVQGCFLEWFNAQGLLNNERFR